MHVIVVCTQCWLWGIACESQSPIYSSSDVGLNSHTICRCRHFQFTPDTHLVHYKVIRCEEQWGWFILQSCTNKHHRLEMQLSAVYVYFVIEFAGSSGKNKAILPLSSMPQCPPIPTNVLECVHSIWCMLKLTWNCHTAASFTYKQCIDKNPQYQSDRLYCNCTVDPILLKKPLWHIYSMTYTCSWLHLCKAYTSLHQPLSL